MLVHADSRNYATALVALDPEALAQFARAHGLPDDDYPALTRDPLVDGYVRECVDQLNARLNRWETVKDVRVLDHDLSVEQDELTPSMKVKRKVIEARYRALLDSMYGVQRPA
jgi:long-chain acyl-CoA synthetase